MAASIDQNKTWQYHDHHRVYYATEGLIDWSPILTDSRGARSSSSADQSLGDAKLMAHIPLEIGAKPTHNRRLSIHEETSVSLAELARKMGLSSHYQAVHPFASPCMPPPPETLVDNLVESPTGSFTRSQTALDTLDGILASDKWDVDRDSVALIASSFALGDPRLFSTCVADFTVKYNDLKAEKPLLKRDHDIELQRLKQRDCIRYDLRGLEECPLDSKNDESLVWPSHYIDLPEQMHQEMWDGSLDVDETTVGYLQEILETLPADQMDFLPHFLRSERVRRLEPLSPPLLSETPPENPRDLPSPLMEVELMSTPEDLSAREAAVLERWVAEADDFDSPPNAGSSESCASMLQRSNPCGTPMTPEIGSILFANKIGKRDLDIESPLLLEQVSIPSAQTEDVAMSALASGHLIPPQDSDISLMDIEHTQAQFCTFVRDFVMPAAEEALQQVEVEDLSEVDTTVRVKIPHIEDIQIAGPWESYGKHEQKLLARQALLATIVQGLLKDQQPWGGLNKLDRILTWSPFPARLGRVTLDEEFDDDRSAVKYLATLEFNDEPDMDSLLCRTNQLHLLGDHDGDDDGVEAISQEANYDEDVTCDPPTSGPITLPLEVQSKFGTAAASGAPGANISPTRLDMRTLLRKRKLELEKASMAKDVFDTADPTHRVCDPHSKLAKTIDHSAESGTHQLGYGIVDFMQLHGAFINVSKNEKALTNSASQHLAPEAIMIPLADQTVIQQKDELQLANPTIWSVLEGTQVVLSAALLADRTIVRRLHTISPGLDFVDRDALSLAKNSNKSATDADITVSPATGIMLTTLQRLKQKPLPGHVSYYGVFDRISDVSLRYERLIIFVSDGQYSTVDDYTDAKSLDERDCEALANLMARTSHLEAEIVVHFVAGGEVHLMQWVAAAITRHAVQDGCLKLLQDETMWERLLRTAGMNPFAAQVVLGHLKTRDTEDHSDASRGTTNAPKVPFGLVTFLQMSASQRVREFESVLGGHRVLRRISEVIDSTWVSATVR